MQWKQKAAIQRALSVVPGGMSVNYLLQRIVTPPKKIQDSSFIFRAKLAADHLDAAVRILDRPASSLAVYEFGAGSDLIGPLTLAARDVPKQLTVDQDVLLRPRQVRDALQRFDRFGATLGLAPLPRLRLRTRRQLIDDLRDKAGIDYRAPFDATKAAVPAESMDLITSNSTLEHVPREELDGLIAECRRLLRADGVMCFRIDYEDHFAILDTELSPYNFLRYSDREWRRYNSRLQFQNRLRHTDYLKLFDRTGLCVVSVDTVEPSADALANLAQIKISAEFRTYSLEELGTRKGTFLLKKA